MNFVGEHDQVSRLYRVTIEGREMKENGALGRIFEDGEIIVRQGEKGNCMYVIQEGQVEIIQDRNDGEVRLAVRGKGDFIGEMAIFDTGVRTATVRAQGQVRLLTVDRKNFLRRIHEDPTLAFRLVQTLIRRVQELSDEVSRLKGEN